MANDEDLKELFNNKNDDEAFQFDEGNWEKMSSVLKKEKKRRRVLIYLSLFIGLVGLPALYFLNSSQIPATSIASGASRSVSSTIEPEISQGDKPEKGLRVPENGSVSQLAVKEKRPKLSKPEDKALSPIEVNTKAPVQLTTKASEEEVNEQPRQQNPEKSNSKDSRLADVSPTETPVLESLPSETVKINKQAPVAENPTVAGQAVEPTKPLDPLPLAVKLPLISDSATTVVPVKSPLSKADSLARPNPTAQDSLLKNNSFFTALFFDLGANYLMGWQTGGKKEASGFNPFIGFTYLNPVTKKIAFSIGIQYTSVNHLNKTSYTAVSTRVRFGEESDVTTITAAKMHYILMPLKLNYSLSDKDLFSVGYNIGYLLDVESRVETYTTRMGYRSEPVLANAMGYRSGFSVFDGQLALGYRRRIINGLYANAELFYGIKDIKDNLVYNTKGFERTYGGKLGLSLNLLKK